MATDMQETPGPFDSADFYDCDDDAESLTHTDVEDAIEEYVDRFLSPNCDTAAEIAKIGTVVVRAWARSAASETWADNEARFLAEQAAERFDEEFGNPDGDGDAIPSPAVLALRVALVEPLRTMVAAANVWRCEPCGERAYTAEEVEAMMREENPQWFEVETTESAT